MDTFEMYLVNNLKYWSDKLSCLTDDNERFMAMNVYDELSDVYVAYKNNKVGKLDLKEEFRAS